MQTELAYLSLFSKYARQLETEEPFNIPPQAPINLCEAAIAGLCAGLGIYCTLSMRPSEIRRAVIVRLAICGKLLFVYPPMKHMLPKIIKVSV